MHNRFLHPAADALRQGGPPEGALPPGLIDLPLRGGETPLGRAASDGAAEDVAALLAAGADPDAPDLRGVPPIVHAAIGRRAENLTLLINHGAAPDGPDANGRTALHYAFLFGDVDLILPLLEAGADLTRGDIDGRIALDYARAVYEGKDVKSVAQGALEFMAVDDQLDAADGPRPKPKVDDMRGDSDFRRIDLLQQADAFGMEGISAGAIYAIFGAAIVIGIFSENPVLGLSVFYVALLYRLFSAFIFRPDAVEVKDAAPPPGASVREMSFILRAASRHVYSKVDRGIEAPAATSRIEVKIWLCALVAPVASVLIIALCGGVIAGVAYLLMWIPYLGYFVALAMAMSVATVGPRMLVGLMQSIFGFLTVPLLAEKITARQSALSADINARRDLRDGGAFIDGGVLYLRSFAFDGTFISGGIDFELLLLRLFQDRAAVYALNADSQSRGVLNIQTSDANWRDVVDDMLRRSGLILMIPAETPGVMEEIAALERDGWFAKTLFIAPPEHDFGGVGAAWEAMRLRPELSHLEIPPYCDAGFLFRLGPDGALVEAGPLGLDRMPMPLPRPQAPFEGRPDPTADDAQDLSGSPSDGGFLDDGPLIEGGAAANASTISPDAAQGAQASSAASSTALASSSLQLTNLGMMMQTAPVLSAGEFHTLSGAEFEAAADGGDGGGG